MSEPWWERFPEVLCEEEADLTRLGGGPPTLNQELLEQANVRQYDVRYNYNGHTYDLTVTYSDLHPYFRVEVASKQTFRAHQQPFRGNLCLLRGGTWNWNVDETAAQFIESQMPLLIADNTHGDEAKTLCLDNADSAETNQADTHVEPFVQYYTYASRSVIRVDGGWTDITEADGGTLVLGLDQPLDLNALRGIVLELRDEVGTLIRQADPRIMEGYPTRVTGRWGRLRERPERDDPQFVLDFASDVLPPVVGAARTRLGEFDLDLVGVVFTDGVKPGTHGDAWMFIVHATAPRSPQRPTSGRGNRRSGRVAPERRRIGPYLTRAVRSGPADMTERIPTLAPVRTKKIVMFGAGGVGAPSAVEFAKAGVGHLVVVEGDLVEPGNAPRWVLGYRAAGLHKLEGLYDLIRWNWPYTVLEPVGWRLGLPRSGPDQRAEWDMLNELLTGADLIYDATAEIGVNYFLSDIAKEFELPYVVVSATEGGWGGRVARFRSGVEEPCWVCLMHHEQDDPRFIPLADPNPATREVWPAGCTDPTFTGAGFDIMAIATAGVRLALSTMCEGLPGAYPPANWDVATYEFRNESETFPGTATTYVVRPHPRCEPCRIRRSG